MFSDCRPLIQCDSEASNLLLKANHKKPLYQMPRFTRNSEQCQLLLPVPALLLYELSNQHFPSFPVQWKSSQLSWPLWSVLCPSIALWWCYCKVYANVPHETCTSSKEKVKKSWLLFLCAHISRLAVKRPFFKYSNLPLKLCVTKPSCWLIVHSAHRAEQNGLLILFWKIILKLKCQHG